MAQIYLRYYLLGGKDCTVALPTNQKGPNHAASHHMQSSSDLYYQRLQLVASNLLCLWQWSFNNASASEVYQSMHVLVGQFLHQPIPVGWMMWIGWAPAAASLTTPHLQVSMHGITWHPLIFCVVVTCWKLARLACARSPRGAVCEAAGTWPISRTPQWASTVLRRHG